MFAQTIVDAPKNGREQPRRGDLGAERRDPHREDEDVEEAVRLTRLSRSSRRAPWPDADRALGALGASGTPRSAARSSSRCFSVSRAGPAQERPREHAEGDQRALGHHDHAGDALVGER